MYAATWCRYEISSIIVTIYMHRQLHRLHIHGHVQFATLYAASNLAPCFVCCVVQLYQEFGATYKHWFEFLLPRSNQKLMTGHHPSSCSFKIIAECPVIGRYPDDAFTAATASTVVAVRCMQICADACIQGTSKGSQQMECIHSVIQCLSLSLLLCNLHSKLCCKHVMSQLPE